MACCNERRRAYSSDADRVALLVLGVRRSRDAATVCNSLGAQLADLLDRGWLEEAHAVREASVLEPSPVGIVPDGARIARHLRRDRIRRVREVVVCHSALTSYPAGAQLMADAERKYGGKGTRPASGAYRSATS